MVSLVTGADKPRLTIPAYDLAAHSFMSSVMDGLIGVVPILGQMPVRITGHAGPTRNVPGDHPLDHPLTVFRETLLIHADVIRGTAVESFVASLTELAGKYEEKMGKTLVETIGGVAEAVGNVVDAREQPLSWDFLLDAFEKIDWSFDEEGHPLGQQILVNPETAKLLRALDITLKQQQRYHEIIQRKKEQWDAQKRTRRLPRSDQGAGA